MQKRFEGTRSYFDYKVPQHLQGTLDAAAKYAEARWDLGEAIQAKREKKEGELAKLEVILDGADGKGGKIAEMERLAAIETQSYRPGAVKMSKEDREALDNIKGEIKALEEQRAQLKLDLALASKPKLGVAFAPAVAANLPSPLYASPSLSTGELEKTRESEKRRQLVELALSPEGILKLGDLGRVSGGEQFRAKLTTVVESVDDLDSLRLIALKIPPKMVADHYNRFQGSRNKGSRYKLLCGFKLFCNVVDGVNLMEQEAAPAKLVKLTFNPLLGSLSLDELLNQMDIVREKLNSENDTKKGSDLARVLDITITVFRERISQLREQVIKELEAKVQSMKVLGEGITKTVSEAQKEVSKLEALHKDLATLLGQDHETLRVVKAKLDTLKESLEKQQLDLGKAGGEAQEMHTSLTQLTGIAEKSVEQVSAIQVQIDEQQQGLQLVKEGLGAVEKQLAEARSIMQVTKEYVFKRLEELESELKKSAPKEDFLKEFQQTSEALQAEARLLLAEEKQLRFVEQELGNAKAEHESSIKKLLGAREQIAGEKMEFQQKLSAIAEQVMKPGANQTALMKQLEDLKSIEDALNARAVDCERQIAEEDGKMAASVSEFKNKAEEHQKKAAAYEQKANQLQLEIVAKPAEGLSAPDKLALKQTKEIEKLRALKIQIEQYMNKDELGIARNLLDRINVLEKKQAEIRDGTEKLKVNLVAVSTVANELVAKSEALEKGLTAQAAVVEVVVKTVAGVMEDLKSMDESHKKIAEKITEAAQVIEPLKADLAKIKFFADAQVAIAEAPIKALGRFGEAAPQILALMLAIDACFPSENEDKKAKDTRKKLLELIDKFLQKPFAERTAANWSKEVMPTVKNTWVGLLAKKQDSELASEFLSQR